LIAALWTHIGPRDFMTFDQAVGNNTGAARRSPQMAGIFRLGFERPARRR
jgi:hypothetical protein